MILLLSVFIVSTVLSSLDCPSGKVSVSTPNDGYLECTNSTSTLICGENGSCEIVNISAKSHQICCIPSSLLCSDGQFMYGGRCYEESDLPNDKTLDKFTSSCPFGTEQSTQSNGSIACLKQQFPLRQFGNCQLGQVSFNGGCLPLVMPGDFCQVSEQCMDSSTCNSQRCVCSNFNAQAIHNYCIVPSTSCPDNKQTFLNGRCVSYATVGNTCEGQGQCLGGSTCTNQMCTCPSHLSPSNGFCVQNPSNSNSQCPTGQTRVNGNCVSLAAPGTQCVSSNQCIDQSTCNSGICQCTNSGAQVVIDYCVVPTPSCGNTHKIQINNQCVFFATPNSPCITNEQCVGGSICMSSKCTCPQGTTFMNGYCISSGGNTGNCPNGQVSVNGLGCLPVVQLGAPCQSAMQCPSNAICEGTCQCPSGFTSQNGQCVSGGSNGGCQLGKVSVNGQCLSLAAPGNQCQSSLQCIDSSSCLSQRCSCSNSAAQIISNYCLTPATAFGCSQMETSVNGRCLSFVKPGFPCQFSQQCVGGSICNQMCVCPSGTTEMNKYCISSSSSPSNPCQTGQVLVNGACVNKSPLGGQCQQAAQCGDNTQCSDGFCSCAFGYQQVQSNCVRSSDSGCQRGEVSINGQCVTLSHPGDRCVSPLQCIDNSNCQNGFCACAATNMQALNNYCVIPGTTSGCGQTQARVNGNCVTFSIVGQPCVGSEQCVGGSMCVSQQCVCPMGRYSMKGYCLIDAATSGNCNALTQIRVNGNCYSLVQPGQQCQVSQQCIGGGECRNSFCQNGLNCPFGQVAVGGSCMPIVQPGGFCQASQQCANNGQCISNTCQGGSNGQCKNYQISSNGQCLDTVSIGQQCSVQQQCINNANCISSRCQCNSGFTFIGHACLSAGVSPICTGLTVSANGQCLQLAQMYQFCTATPQCMGFSACISSSCRCPYAYSEVNGVCRKSTSVNNCPFGQVMSPSGVCLSTVGVGGSCQINEQCPSGSSCTMGRCTQGSSGGLTCNDPSKEVAMANGTPINCMVQLCPADAQCENVQQQFVCCRPRSTPGGSGVCPNNQQPELLPSGQIKNCMQQQCSNGRVCQYTNANTGYVCCVTTFG
ncbi:hypothetical protein PFISCL1PPCAC_10684 [Pristionchus fissidentatus]|uniref:EGF-like domain-containing protein n=1 Tax=Pristionchus fissidentatus TaxID=1538716 RepID=A0AAV5VI33_9BILA|nr:hypothetical protein PFISCL1PPCAC_10684 [Pristionchus fissidentatus]